MMEWLLRSGEEARLALDGRELPIVVKRHPTAKQMVLRLSPAGDRINVTVPRWGRAADAIAFARSRRNWLQRQLRDFPVKPVLLPDGHVRYRGRWLKLEWNETAPRKPAISGERLAVGGPLEGLERRVQQWLEREMLRLTQEDAGAYCDKAGTECGEVRLSRAKRRWGSCSANGTIRVNWRLVQAPDSVRRAVVAHEVAHKVHFDHSPAFHRLLKDIYDDDLDAANRWLRLEGRGLYATFG